jgi:hypothetical protein
LSAENKFLYLKSFLKTPAAELIAGFIPSEYKDAVKILEENYGREEVRIRQLYQQLALLPQASKLDELQKLHLSIERICRQLSAAKEDIEGRSIYWMLEGKLNRTMLREINVAKKEAEKAHEPWNTSLFRKEFKKLLDEELALSDVVKQGKAPGKEDKKPEKGGKSPGTSSAGFPTVSCGTVDKGKGNGNGKQDSKGKKGKDKPPVYGCAFCGQEHWANKCDQYKGRAAREKRLNEVGRCLQCLKMDHQTANCPKPSKCVKCKEQHPLALCQKVLFQNQQQKNSPAKGANAVPIGKPGGEDVAGSVTCKRGKQDGPSF